MVKSQQPVNIFNKSGGGGWMNVSHVVHVSTISNTFTFQNWSYKSDQRASLV